DERVAGVRAQLRDDLPVVAVGREVVALVLHPDDRDVARAGFLDHGADVRHHAVPLVGAAHDSVLHVDNEERGVRAVLQRGHRLPLLVVDSETLTLTVRRRRRPAEAVTQSRQVSALFVFLWFAGGIPVAILSEVVKADSPRIARAGRVAFALLLGVDLLLAAAAFSAGNSNPDARLHATRSIWWLTVVAGGIPLALVSGRAVRRGYVGHRLVLAGAAVLTAALYLVFPLGFVPSGEKLTGLGRFAHEHHALGIAV